MKSDNKEVDVKDRDLYIFGHMNPDTDSICSTLAYAKLKEKLGYKKVHACRLGNINKETRFVLNYLQIKEPEFIDSIKPMVSDLQYYDTGVIGSREDVKTAVERMKEGGVSRRILPVVSDRGRLIGIISNSNIMKSLEKFYVSEQLESEIYVSNLLDNLEPFNVIGTYDYDRIKGNIYVDSIAVEKEIKDYDVVVSTNELLTNEIIQLNKKIIVIIPSTTKIDIEIYLEDLKKNNVENNMMIIYSKFGLLHTLHQIAQAISVYSLMSSSDLEYFENDEYIEDVKPIVIDSKYTHFPIVDKDNMVQGVLSRRHLLRYQKKNVILMDHNEIGQTIKGIKEANIIEIVDHHKIDSISTDYPPLLRMEPVGATATIVYKLYRENNVEIDKEIATLLLSAILSDTLCLHSPTCTEQDGRIAKELAKIAELNIETYGKELLTSSLDIKDDEWEEAIKTDIKKFNVGKYYIEISNLNIAEYKTILDRKENIKEYMTNVMRNDRCDTFILMLTDIINNGAYIICVGKDEKIFNNAFGIPYGEDSIFLPDVLSRKKQVLPRVISAVEKIIK